FDLTFDASELGVEFGVLRAELRVDRVQRLAARRRALFDFQNWRQKPAKFLNLLERGSQRAGQLGKRCLALVLGALAFRRDRHELVLQLTLAREHAVSIRKRARCVVRRVAVVGHDADLTRIERELREIGRTPRGLVRPEVCWRLALELEVPELVTKIERRAEQLRLRGRRGVRWRRGGRWRARIVPQRRRRTERARRFELEIRHLEAGRWGVRSL